MDWFDLLAVQRTLKSLLQHHSSKASILCHSGFFMVQLSHLYMTTGKTIALTVRTFINKVMSLHFNSLSRLVIGFLPRSKCLLISWLQSPSTVIFSLFTQSCPTLCDPMDGSMPGLPVYHQLLKFTQLMSIESVMPSSHLILCHPLLLLPSFFPSIRVFSNVSALCIRWPKYWSFSFSISPSNEQPGLISFRMDWLDLLAVQGTLKSLLQHHSSKASILWCSVFFIVQLSLTSIHDYWKNHSLD